MRNSIQIVEKYTTELCYFRDYMKDAEFDPYANWSLICKWLEKNEPDLVQELAGCDADELREEEPEFFEKLPADVQEQCARYVQDYVMRHDPASAATHQHMMLSQEALLHRQTWLVHFSDHAKDIALNGFKYGVDQMDRLGLTGWLHKDERSSPGYNFAFAAFSRDAVYCATQGKYGRDAVLFRSSGVECYHHGDEETQIVFRGPEVHTDGIVYLRQGDDGY